LTNEPPVGLRLERCGEIAVLVLGGARRLNPLREELQLALRARCAELRNDESVRALVLTGEGEAFSVGADLSTMSAAEGEPSSLGQRVAEKMHELSNRLILDLRRLPFPVVSAVNGACAGAAVGLALAADVVLAARSAYFYLPFIPKLGIVPDLGATWFLERLLGRARSTAVALLGERCPAEQAARWGLIWQCVDDVTLREQALSMAYRLAALPPNSIVELRDALDTASTNTLAAQLDYEAERQRELIDTPSFAEGVSAFLSKREPRFPPR